MSQPNDPSRAVWEFRGYTLEVTDNNKLARVDSYPQLVAHFEALCELGVIHTIIFVTPKCLHEASWACHEKYSGELYRKWV